MYNPENECLDELFKQAHISASPWTARFGPCTTCPLHPEPRPRQRWGTGRGPGWAGRGPAPPRRSRPRAAAAAAAPQRRGPTPSWSGWAVEAVVRGAPDLMVTPSPPNKTPTPIFSRNPKKNECMTTMSPPPRDVLGIIRPPKKQNRKP